MRPEPRLQHNVSYLHLRHSPPMYVPESQAAIRGGKGTNIASANAIFELGFHNSKHCKTIVKIYTDVLYR